MKKEKISQDELFKFLTTHGIKLVRLSELTGMSEGTINSCFKHQLINKGTPRSFTPAGVEKLNAALEHLADALRGLKLKWGTDESKLVVNQRGTTYDHALVEPIKQIGEWMNLTALVERVLGWGKEKKASVLVSGNPKTYGNISEQDMLAINNELLTVAGVLGSYEVVADSNDTISTE